MRLRIAAFFALTIGILLLGSGATATATEPSPAEPTPSAVAPEDSVYKLAATLVDNRGITPPETGKPVPGVTLVVSDAEGAVVAEGVSDAQGKILIPLPNGGAYSAELDETTLPEGTTLSGASGNSLSFTVNLEGTKALLFPIRDAPVAADKYERFINSAVSGVKFSLIVALAALGLSMIFGTTGLTNFAHGELITFGALVAYGFNRGLGTSVIVAGLLTIVVSGMFGYAQDKGLWRPLRRRGTGLVAMMIVSIGLALFLRNIYQYVFGGSTKSLSQYVGQSRQSYGPIELAPKEIGIIVVAIVAITVVCVALVKTRLGKATRAVADNPALAASSGLRVDGVISAVWIVGTALTGLAGVLVAIDQQIEYQSGFKLLLIVFAAVTLGGLGTVWGALIGSMIVGMLVEISPILGVPAELKYVGALLALILILLVRPQGILGRRERVG